MKRNNQSKTIQFQAITRKITSRIKLNSNLLRNKRVLIILGIMIGILGSIYIAGGLFFTNHFYWGTSINGINVGGESLDEAQARLEAKSSAYTLALQERNEKTETLMGGEIGLTYRMGDRIRKLKERQGAWDWPVKLFEHNNLEVEKEISYDKELLKNRMNELKCLTDKNIRAPEDASIKYIDGIYKIIEGDKGNTVNTITLYEAIVKAIMSEELVINLELNDCYKGPLYSKESPKLNSLKNELNGYLNAEITYDFGDRQEIIDKTLLSSWLSMDDNMQVILNEEAIAEYVIDLAKSYDTLGKERDFVATTGNRVKVIGGDYGWKVNVQDEIGELIKLIKEGKPVKRIPLYSHTALKTGINDIGETYVEINLSKQYIWFYKEGKLIVESDIVTGNLKRNYDTPQGTYTLDYKKADTVLRGPGYASPVKYWMPFNGGIGLHDASWRSRFGGEIYRTDGSHGCVNLPIQVAGDIFNNIDAGVPVICYFESK